MQGNVQDDERDGVAILQYSTCESASMTCSTTRSSVSQSVSPSTTAVADLWCQPAAAQHSTTAVLHGIVNIALHCTALQRVHTAPRSYTPELHYPLVPWGLRTTTLSARGPAHASVQDITTTVSDCRDCTTASALQPASQAGVGRSGHICGLGASLTWNMGWDSLTARPDMCFDGGHEDKGLGRFRLLGRDTVSLALSRSTCYLHAFEASSFGRSKRDC